MKMSVSEALSGAKWLADSISSLVEVGQEIIENRPDSGDDSSESDD